ncbi:MAG TPA: hypothetical protein VEW42_06290 [Candidatus Eisenbacteria bacterium]|nr:hypothetical protein [Candidatus Eisenbacteria bacterium]
MDFSTPQEAKLLQKESSSSQPKQQDVAPEVLRERKLTQQFGPEEIAFWHRIKKTDKPQIVAVRRKEEVDREGVPTRNITYSILNNDGDRVGYLMGRESEGADGLVFDNSGAFSNTDLEAREEINRYNADPTQAPIIAGSVTASLAHLAGKGGRYAHWYSSAVFKTIQGVQHGFNMFAQGLSNYPDLVDVAMTNPPDPTRVFDVTPVA